MHLPAQRTQYGSSQWAFSPVSFWYMGCPKLMKTHQWAASTRCSTQWDPGATKFYRFRTASEKVRSGDWQADHMTINRLVYCSIKDFWSSTDGRSFHAILCLLLTAPVLCAQNAIFGLFRRAMKVRTILKHYRNPYFGTERAWFLCPINTRSSKWKRNIRKPADSAYRQ